MKTRSRDKRQDAAAILAAVAVLVAVALAPAAKADQNAKQPSSYWGAWIGSQLTGGQPPWDMSSVARFEQLTGKAPSLLEFAAPFADCSSSPCSFYHFPTYEMNTIRNYGAVPFFSWGSQSIPVPANLDEPDFQLADITAGTYDSYIREFAEGAREWGHPFFLRFDWEMNGNWFPWAEGANGNKPGDYVAAWRHVHDVFTSVGATNVNWVWCPYADAKGSFGPLARYFPGNSYLDWSSLDGFNWAKNGVNPQPWRTFDQIFSSSYKMVVKKLAPSKPMILAEMASGGASHAKANWIDAMFKNLRTKYRRIRGLIWFEQVDRGVQWPIETSPKVTQAFRRGVKQSGFKRNLYSELGGTRIAPPH
jgi:hypothetical protein